MILNKYKEKIIKTLTVAKKTKKDGFLSKIINFCYDYKKQDFKNTIIFLLAIFPVSFTSIFSFLNNISFLEFLFMLSVPTFLFFILSYFVFLKLFQLIIYILNLNFYFDNKVESKEKFLILKRIKNLSENESGEDSKLLIEIFEYLKTEERKVVFDEFTKIIYSNLEDIESDQIKKIEEKQKIEEEIQYKKELEKINIKEEINIKEDVFSNTENLKNNRKFKV